jgi:GTP-binding protein EngB required for normal cell division
VELNDQFLPVVSQELKSGSLSGFFTNHFYRVQYFRSSGSSSNRMSGNLVFENYSDDDDDIDTEKIKSRVILIVGLTGSGKSSIIKAICSHDENGQPVQVKMSVRSVTKNLQEYSNNLVINPKDRDDKYAVTLIDTVGLGDTHVDVQTILKQIVENMPICLSTIHRIVFCFKMDRLRAKMSEELSIMYKFFKLVGAQPENFVLCLTFCDILNDKTIGAFWEDLKKYEDLEMVKEIENVTYTSFPNLDECDNDESLRVYLDRKARISRRRVFSSVISDEARAFHPHDAMIRMPPVDFDVLCGLLKNYNQKRRWYWGVINKTEQEEMIHQLLQWRPPSDENKKDKEKEKEKEKDKQKDKKKEKEKQKLFEVARLRDRTSAIESKK